MCEIPIIKFCFLGLKVEDSDLAKKELRIESKFEAII
jgi:hypothetical protein